MRCSSISVISLTNTVSGSFVWTAVQAYSAMAQISTRLHNRGLDAHHPEQLQPPAINQTFAVNQFASAALQGTPRHGQMYPELKTSCLLSTCRTTFGNMHPQSVP